MRANHTLLALLGATSSAWAVDFPSRRDLEDTPSPIDTVPRRFIVELKSRAQCTRLFDKVAATAGLSIVKQFDSDLFPGVSVECDHDCTPDSLRAALDDPSSDIAVATVYQSTRVRILDTVKGESFSDDAAASNYSVHGITGVEKLHRDGILGAGATVAIVDSGAEYTHPALGGGIGPGFKILGGYDLVGDGNWPDTPAVPDEDPMDYYGHGTHVAGIIAGQSDQFVGVAPEANLLSFKVFNKDGYSNEETVIEGFLKAFESGADIISASVGEGGGFTTNAWAVVASRMVDQGVVVVIAAGNSGEDGPFEASNGASGAHVLTIASSEPGQFPAQLFSADFNLNGQTNTTNVSYIPGIGIFPSDLVDRPIIPLTPNTSIENDACKPLPSDTEDLADRIVLVRSGGCALSNKHENLVPFNPRYILFYSNDGPYEDPYTRTSPGSTGLIEARAGEAIIETILAGGNVTASFNVNNTGHYVGLFNAGSGRPARYTSWGATYDLALKPDVSAPGTKILSTYLNKSYQVLSGTSMATPYIAGVAALYVGQFGGRNAHQGDPAWAKRLVSRITTTGRAVPWADWTTSAKDYGFWAPTVQVGSGLVDAAAVLNYTTELSFDGRKFEMNDTANFVGTHSVDVFNNGKEAVTYKFTLQGAGGFESWKPESPNLKRYDEIVLVKYDPIVDLPGDLTVEPGQKATVEVTFTPPTGLSATKLPVYSGKVLISGSNGEELGIPYFGVASDLKKTVTEMYYTALGFPYLQSGPRSTDLSAKPNITFNLTVAAQDFPRLNNWLIWGSREVRWDIFDPDYTEADWAYPPVIGEKHYIGSATSWTGTDTASYFNPAIHNQDDIFPLPQYNIPRGVWKRYWWLGRYANGSTVLPGDYHFRIAVLRPFGDPTLAEDWEVVKVPKITVLPGGTIGQTNATLF
ncbi:minor extracellular protease vpr [Diaporthe helianthi]|uniref:Minor extracellular protease vpr n=1 Tax=Diaporthe helianthi TaxID=158607 RepID=A0A2P5HT34_DIAHE|nr:minor extracellular protease vpr [Diaporthe helianthi]